MPRSRVTRKIEFDAGHRIPNHMSKCRNLHGHRYVLEATFEGPVQPEEGTSCDGMVADFSHLKQLLMDLIHERFDHAMIFASSDPFYKALGMEPFTSVGASRVEVVGFVPTAENLVRHFASLIVEALSAGDSGFELASMVLYETPNCWAEWNRGQ